MKTARIEAQQQLVLRVLTNNHAPWEIEHRRGGLTVRDIANELNTAPMLVEACLMALEDQGKVEAWSAEQTDKHHYRMRWYLTKRKGQHA